MKHRGGGGFRRIRPSDVEWIFDAYDSSFFNGQISRRLKTSRGEIAFRVTKFPEKSECYISAGPSGRNYFFDISTSIFKAVGENKYCYDRAICLMLAIEHQIVHLLMLLYDYHEKIPGNVIYSSHGDLYTCMSRMFFGDIDHGHDMESRLSSKAESPAEESPPPGKNPERPGRMQQIVANRIGRFSNVRNSCFLDSLLFVLLVSDGSNYIRPILFDSDVSNIPYNVKHVCDRSRTVRTRQQVADLAGEVRETLKKDHERLVKGDVFQCNNLRDLLRKCDPEIGSGDAYTPTEVYGIFAHLYPKLQVYFPPKIVVREDAVTGLPMKPRETLETVQKITFSDLEYSPYNVRARGVYGFGSFYLWDDINEPLLVFHNTGSNKNKFTEYIFQNRYRLFGAVMSRGRVSTTKEGGGHYNAYLRINGKWFFYDDIPPTTLRLLDKLPDEVFKRGPRSIGELLFYERIEEIPARQIPPVEADRETAVFKSAEADNRGNYVLTFKYYDEYIGDVLQSLGGKLISKDDELYARWKFPNTDLLRDKRDEIENATKLNITVSPQGDGSIMIYAEDRYGGLGEEFGRLGGKLVGKNKTYYGLAHHLKNRDGASGGNIRDYYWRVSKEEFNHALSKIQNAKS